MKLYEPSTIKEIKENFGFKFSKSLGQNFLTNKNIIDKIISGMELEASDTVLEIGPGIGVITAEAAQKASKVIAVEIDKNLIPILSKTLSQFDNVKIVNEDILKTDVKELLAGEGVNRVKVVGNLPYYITTPIIMKLLISCGCRCPASCNTLI